MFNAARVEPLISSASGDTPEKDETVGFVVPIPSKAQSPFYEQDGFALYLGDSLKILPRLPANHFDMVFADPLYHLSNGGFTVQSGKRASVDKGKWDASRRGDRVIGGTPERHAESKALIDLVT